MRFLFVFLALLASTGLKAQDQYVTPKAISDNPQYEARFRQILDGFGQQMKHMGEVYNEIMADSSLSSEKRSAKAKTIVYGLQAALMDSISTQIRNNSNTPIGSEILGIYYGNLSIGLVDTLLQGIPERCLTDKAREAKQLVEVKKLTAVGMNMIDFTQQTPDGKTLTLSQVVKANKLTLIDFWASWCVPCKGEMPYVKKAYEAFKDKGFQIVGVSLDNKADRWTKAIESWQLPWLHVSDLKGWKCEPAALYGVRAIPASFLISQDGKIVAVDLRGDALYNKLNEILK